MGCLLVAIFTVPPGFPMGIEAAGPTGLEPVHLPFMFSETDLGALADLLLAIKFSLVPSW